MMEKDDSKSSKDVPALHKDNPKYLLTFVRQTISGFLEKGSPTHAHEKKQMKSGLVSSNSLKQHTWHKGELEFRIALVVTVAE